MVRFRYPHKKFPRKNLECKNLDGTNLEYKILKSVKSEDVIPASTVLVQLPEILLFVPKKKRKGKRPLGRPKQRWCDKIAKDLTILGVENYREVTLDREGWKEVCNTSMGLNGLNGL
ncbi:Hypothetical protein CINCED_3A005645 [Cinara cedri]|uniref:Uncharacterized protein n=1 Tax=Cinara cedri TaxID=506608 RepID=A0A5E4N054_9HEMI|nr:Hypothetical protein CINCED_3A005645 [Cinara cedri]